MRDWSNPSLSVRLLLTFSLLVILVLGAAQWLLREGLPGTRFVGVRRTLERQAVERVDRIAARKSAQLVALLRAEGLSLTRLARDTSLQQLSVSQASDERQHALDQLVRVWARDDAPFDRLVLLDRLERRVVSSSSGPTSVADTAATLLMGPAPTGCWFVAGATTVEGVRLWCSEEVPSGTPGARFLVAASASLPQLEAYLTHPSQWLGHGAAVELLSVPGGLRRAAVMPDRIVVNTAATGPRGVALRTLNREQDSWMLRASLSRAEMLPVLTALDRWTFGLDVMALGIALLATALLARRLALPLVRLRAAADAFAGGDLAVRSGVSGGGEVGSLGRAFDAMAERLESQVVEIAVAQRELSMMAKTDRLTGVGNRRYFDDNLEHEFALASRYNIPVSVLLCDVDHFKKINDVHGHPVGDEVLVGIAERIRQRVRDTDSLARWGGEEFAVLAPCTSAVGAASLAEQLRSAVEGEDFPGVGRVTISIGVAELRLPETTADWLDRVDELLYLAKSRGRNRVQCEPDSSAHNQTFALEFNARFLTGDHDTDCEHEELFVLARAMLDAASQPEPTLARTNGGFWDEDPPTVIATPKGGKFTYIGGQLMGDNHPRSRRVQHLLECTDRLLSHLRLHFQAEEARLAKAGFSGIERHAKDHLSLLEALGHLREQALDGSLEMERLVDFVVRKLAIGHLVHGDIPAFAAIFSRRSSVPPSTSLAQILSQRADVVGDDATGVWGGSPPYMTPLGGMPAAPPSLRVGAHTVRPPRNSGTLRAAEARASSEFVAAERAPEGESGVLPKSETEDVVPRRRAEEPR